MAFGSFDANRHQGPIVEMNVVPLVDVMLVLLVIFIMTAPFLTNAVNIDLPRASGIPSPAKVTHIDVSIRKDGSYVLDGKTVDPDMLASSFARAAKSDRKPELHIRADRLARYERVIKVMSAASKAGLNKIGFVFIPEK